MYCPVDHECSFINKYVFGCSKNACPKQENITPQCTRLNFHKILEWLSQGTDICFPINCTEIVAPNTDFFFGYGSRATTTINAHNNCSGFRTLSNYCGPGNYLNRLTKQGYPPLSLTDQVSMVHDIGWSIAQSDEEVHSVDMALINNLNFIEDKRNEPNANTYAAKRTLNIIKNILKLNQPIGLFQGGWLWDEDEETRVMISQVLEAIINQPRGKNVIPNNGWGFLVKYMFIVPGDNKIYVDLRNKR